LSVIGLAIYLMMRDKKKNIHRPMHHSAPEYRYHEPAAPEMQPAPMVQRTVEPEPVMALENLGPELSQPGTEEQMPRTAAPLTMPEETPEYRTELPGMREKVRGIPRCPKCDAAVSGFDDLCSECGAAIK
jgi:hypothetical protein